jgi:acetate kinase
MPPSELAATLEHRSGLLGLTGSADMRVILRNEADGDADAILAVAVYLHRLRAGIAGMVAAMGGLDAVAFTGGVGEHSPTLRQRAAEGLAHLGLALDAKANQDGAPDRQIGAVGAAVRTFVIEAREDVEIARGVRWVLARRETSPGAE